MSDKEYIIHVDGRLVRRADEMDVSVQELLESTMVGLQEDSNISGYKKLFGVKEIIHWKTDMDYAWRNWIEGDEEEVRLFETLDDVWGTVKTFKEAGMAKEDRDEAADILVNFHRNYNGRIKLTHEEEQEMEERLETLMRPHISHGDLWERDQGKWLQQFWQYTYGEKYFEDNTISFILDISTQDLQYLRDEIELDSDITDEELLRRDIAWRVDGIFHCVELESVKVTRVEE